MMTHEWRCTRPDTADTSGHYVLAVSRNEAVRLMTLRFPADRHFQVQLWRLDVRGAA